MGRDRGLGGAARPLGQDARARVRLWCLAVRGVFTTSVAVLAALAIAPASAQAARVTIGSDLAAPATVARSDPNDIVFWHAAHPTTAIDVPVAGQAIIMRVKGGTVQPRGGSQNPAYDLLHFVVLRPQSDGTWRTTATSVDHRAPVIGNGADEHTVSTFTSVNPLCVQPGDRIGLASVGGFDAQLFPNGLPYQVFARAPGIATSEFRAGGAIAENGTVVRGEPLPDTELLMQVVIGTGSSARPTCGGTAPSGSDPGLLPEPSDPIPPPLPAAQARAFVAAPVRAPRLRRGKVRLAVRCGAGASCSGALSLRARGKQIGRTRYALAAGATRGVSVTLTRAGRRMVRRADRLRVVARVTAGGKHTARVLTIRA
jgi:hypothetical protein